MNITIRRALPADAPVIAQFNQALARETEQRMLDADRLLKGVAAILTDPLKGFYIVAESDGQIIGQLMITYEWSDWRNANFWWIQSVYVHPEFRKHGVFSQLYRFIESTVTEREDACGIRLYVEKENTRAQAAYEKLGMKKAVYELFETDFVLKR
jgi:ribosomal protein S18 acetylase RimI-like enzyme